METLIQTKLSGHEFRLTLLLLRKTYGFNKKEDYISLSQMMQSSKLSKTRCSQIINSLEHKNIVTVTEKCNGLTKKYLFNKHYSKWKPLQKSVTVTEKCNEPLQKNEIEGLQKTVSTKDKHLTKDNIQKTDYVVIWNSFACKHPALAQIKEITASRAKKLNLRLKESSFVFENILLSAEEQDFLMGKNDRKWVFSFDWLIENDTNYMKVLELKYKNKESGNKESKPILI